MSGQAKALLQFSKEVTSKSGTKEDKLLALLPKLPQLQSQLDAAPQALQALASLCAIATKSDFSLEVEGHVFKYLTFPQSNRACMLQIVNEAYEAFNVAHNSMFAVKLQTSMVKGQLIKVLNILFKGTKYEVQNMCPEALRDIRHIADVCASQTDLVVKSYKGVVDVVEEMLLVSEVKQGNVEEAIKTTNFSKEIAKEEKAMHEGFLREANSRVRLVKDEVEKWSTELDEAMDDVPSTGEIFGLNFGDAIINAINVLPTLMQQANVINTGIQAAKEVFTGRPNVPDEKVPKGPVPNMQDTLLASHTRKIIAKIGSLVKSLSDGDKPVLVGTRINILEEKIRECIAKGCNPELGKPVQGLLRSLKKLEKDLSETKTGDTEKMDKIKDRAGELYEEMDVKLMEMNVFMNNPIHSKQSPGMSKMYEESEADKSGSSAQQAVRNAHLKVNTCKEQLERARKTQQKAVAERLKARQEVNKAMNDLAAHTQKATTLADIREVLQMGLHQLGVLLTRWREMKQFFDMIKGLITNAMNPRLITFITEGERLVKAKQAAAILSSVSTDNIYQSAYESERMAYIVNHLATTYHNMSEAHLMPIVGRLHEIVILDPKEHKPQIWKKVEEVNAECMKATQLIDQMVHENDYDFRRRVATRSNEIEASRQKHLPPLPEKEKRELEIKAKDIVDKFDTSNVDVEDYA